MKRKFVYDTDVERVLYRHRVSDKQLRALERAIMDGYGDIVPGTGGMRKIRLGAGGRGRRSGLRILFADYPAQGISHLVTALAKGKRENFTKQERNELKRLKLMLDRCVRS